MPAASSSRPAAGDLARLALAIAAAGVASILAGQDANWDLLNYHLYNPWAWLDGRYGFDLAPAQLQTFLNPLLDLPFYGMVAADWPPRAIAFAMALPAGVAGFFLWKIAAIVFRGLDAPLRTIAILAALVIGLAGVNGISLLGLTMNEWPGTALVLAALWLIVRDLDGGDVRLGTLVAAGLLAGIASGLKLTTATYAAGIAIALLARRPLLRSIGHAFAFGVLVLAGLALAAAWWMVMMNDLYGSPLFPFFNDWFRSPLLPPEPILARRFGPKQAWQWLTLPFELFSPPAGYVSEGRYRDARFPVLAALLLLAAALAWKRGRASTVIPGKARVRSFLLAFFAGSFVVWAAVHSIYRYLLPLEALTGIGIVALIAGSMPPRRAAGTLIAATALLVLTTRYPNWGRASFGEHFLDVHLPPIEPGALIVLTADAPMSYVLTRFPREARHVGIHNNLVQADRATGMRARAAAIVDGHAGPIYQLTPSPPGYVDAIEAYGLSRAPGDCGEVRTNLSRRVLSLCRLERQRRSVAHAGAAR